MTKQDKDTSGSKIWTIGHWTCPIPVFLETLDERSIDMLIDVRAHPGSRRNPQFGTDEMKKWLPENGIAYQLFPSWADGAANKTCRQKSTPAGRTRALKTTRITRSLRSTTKELRSLKN